jgi:Ca-activated chloride channel family protein
MALVALGCAGAVTAQAPPTFSSRIEVVRVDALVTDRGQIVQALGRGDFEVRDNGVVQDVDLVSFQQLPLNVILGLDVSASVSGDRLAHLQSAGLTLLQRLTERDRAALLTFSHAIGLREELTLDVSRVREALSSVTPEGETALVDGTYAAMVLGNADVGRSLLILFSDGLDTASWLSPEIVLESARHSDVVVYGVALRGRVGPKFLRDLSELTGGTVFEVDSTRDLSQAFLRILDEFRQRYLLSFSPRGVSPTGWHTLEVRVKSRRATVNARAGYQAGR